MNSRLLPLLASLLLASTAEAKVPVVASTSLVGDIVRQVGGDRISLTVLAPGGVDPHGFEPTPQDAKSVHDAAAVFLNGAGLENALERIIAAANATGKVCVVSAGVDFLDADGSACPCGDHAGVHASHPGAKPALHDPHVWNDPVRVKIWATNIADRLTRLDPDGRAEYTANLAKTTASLDELDAWCREQLAAIPPDARRYAMDHAVMNYLADRYGFARPVHLHSGFSSMTQPSAREMARVIREIKARGVRAIFVGVTDNDLLASQVAREAGIRVVRLHTCTLGKPGSGVETYQDFMRHNIRTIADSLK